MAARAVLREFGEPNWAYEIRRFGAVWEEQNPSGIMERRLAESLADPVYGAALAIGFVEGFMDGGGERLRAWRDDLGSTLTALLKFVEDDGLLVLPVGVGVSLYEFFGRKFDPANPGGLSPEVEEALERLRIIHDLEPVFAMLGALNERSKTRDFLDNVTIIADDIAASLIETGGAWIRSFLFATGDADKQGQMLGRFIGEAFVELVRAFVEPPELSVVQLISVLGLENDEARTLTAGAAP